MSNPTNRPNGLGQSPSSSEDGVLVDREPRARTPALDRSYAVDESRETEGFGAGEATGRRERVERGGTRRAAGRHPLGSRLLGWLCAMGVAVILVSVLTATGTAIGLPESTINDVVDGAVTNVGAVSIGGAIAVIVVLSIGYLAGGYVAARMARFSPDPPSRDFVTG